MAKSLIILSLSFLFAVQAQAIQRHICTFTFNSSDEKEIFQSKIKDKNVQYHEFVDTNDRDWLDKACNSGIQCDALVISGHFGGAFFGKLKERLSLEDLEKLSCSKTCDGILKSPKEVYLFGCNTLADKTKDSRTPAQYREVLIQDGIAADMADRIVAARYSPLGDSFKSRIQKVFAGVPQIYGFDSIGPAGNTVRPFLNRYFNNMKTSYSTRLDQLEAQKLITTIERANSTLSQASLEWQIALNGTARAVCSGAKENSQKDCGLFDPKLSTAEKLIIAKDLLNSPSRLTHMNSIDRFMRDLDFKRLTATEKSILQSISENKAAKKDIRETVDRLSDTPALQLSFINLGKQLSWFSPEETLNKTKKILGERLADGPAQETKDFICSFSTEIPVGASQIPETFYRNSIGINTLECIQPRDPKIHAKMIDSLDDRHNRDTIIQALRHAHDLSDKNLNRIFTYSQDSNSIVRSQVASLIGDQNLSHPQYLETLKKFAKDQDTRVFEASIRSFTKLNPQDVETQLFLVQELKRQSPLEKAIVTSYIQAVKPSNPRVIAEIKKLAPEINW